jgi:hypothetical protein
MDALVTTALVGTAQQPNLEITTGTEIDTLTARLAVTEPEHKLLLSAGAWALYRQAGKVSETLSTIPEAARSESQAVCTQRITAILERMFQGEHDNLLPEALERIKQAGLRLPYELLYPALNIQDKELRSAIFPVLGERGRWLSQFNPSWSWVGHYLPGAEEAQLAEAESIWQEGTQGQRQSILRLVRASDPTKAREWLAAVWKQEKADARSELLNTFTVGLSATDEEFLEKALDDRAAGVRAVAASLLAHLTSSAFAARMQKRADAMLTYEAKKLIVTVPTTLEKDWLRDGIVAKPTAYGVGQHTWWLTQVLSLVPPAHWVENFGVSADKLISAARANADWHDTLVSCWASAASLHRDEQWCMALWDWASNPSTKKKDATAVWNEQASLLKCMPQHEAEQRILSVFSNPKHPGNEDWEDALPILRKPWSKEFGDTYLQELHNHLSKLEFKKNNSPYNDSWYQSIDTAKIALHPACFAEVPKSPKSWNIPVADGTTQIWQKTYWIEELKKFTEAIRIRQRFIEEIVL